MHRAGRRRPERAHRWGAWGAALAYGAALGASALAVDLLSLRGLGRAQPDVLSLTLVGVGFLALGVFVGARVFAAPGAPEATSAGNPAARAALGISPREIDVLQALAEGLSTKEAARRLGVSPNTIKTHTQKLYQKLEATRRTQALARARDLGLLC